MGNIICSEAVVGGSFSVLGATDNGVCLNAMNDVYCSVSGATGNDI